MPSSHPNKHEQKTQETRRLLLEAAERIFLRDGYEKAELGEIASEAGRTKGAIYGHFESKEEVFLALVETQATVRRAKLHDFWTLSKGREDNLTGLRRFVMEFAANDSWGLLLLEYKLFVVRYPEARERLREAQAFTIGMDGESRYVAMIGPPPAGAMSRTAAIRAMFAILSALQLEAKLDQKALSTDEIVAIVAKVFDTLFGTRG